MIDPMEIWQANVNGEIYEAEFSELVNWIAESSLLETDKVSRGNLRWLEAGRVPALAEFFEAKANGTASPVLPESAAVVDSDYETELAADHDSDQDPASNDEIAASPVGAKSAIDPDFCSVHPAINSKFVCGTCEHPFCKDCPKSYGGSVKICPFCGAMCKEIKALNNDRMRVAHYEGDISAGFGFSDFGKALRYPFKYKTSLIVGGLMFAFLSLGKGAASLGGIFMVAAALICVMFANALTFGVLANTIDNFSQGFTDRDFMPSFDEFSLWDDVVHPLFLSIAVYISSFGLFFVLILGAGWMAWSSFSAQMKHPGQQDLSQMSDNEPQIDLKKIRELSAKYKERNSIINRDTQSADGLTAEQQITVEQEAEFKKLRELAKSGSSDPSGGPMDDTSSSPQEMTDFQSKAAQAAFMEFVKRAGILLFLAGIAFFWGLFYFPAACAVAGYTRSFGATLNPLIGLDTIKHLGFDYVKILLMAFLLSLTSGVIMGILGAVLSPFNLGAFGNPPVTFFGSLVTFYFSIAFAVTLGFALYKNGEKLNLYRG